MTSRLDDLTVHVPEVSPRRWGGAIADVVGRFRAADGTSHARALGYQIVFAVLSGLIGLVGLASVVGVPQVRRVVQHLAETISPGPSGSLLQEAARQGASGGALVAVVGLGAAWVSGMFAVAQVERSANRLAGRDEDRPGIGRYAVAALIAVPVGVLLTLGGLALGSGSAVADGFGLEGTAATAWAVARWPIGLALAGVGLALLMRTAPARPIASTGDLLAGTGVALLLWAAFTGLLSLYFAMSSSSSRTYGPLLAIVALVTWAGLTSLALHLGLATAVELEHGSPSTLGRATSHRPQR
jgi:uncharacterized BrkB/YihY/UPF0761 family membrane protein